MNLDLLTRAGMELIGFGHSVHREVQMGSLHRKEKYIEDCQTVSVLSESVVLRVQAL